MLQLAPRPALRTALPSLVPLLAAALGEAARAGDASRARHVPVALPPAAAAAADADMMETSVTEHCAAPVDEGVLSGSGRAAVAAATAVMEMLGGGGDAPAVIGRHAGDLLPALLSLSATGEHSVRTFAPSFRALTWLQLVRRAAADCVHAMGVLPFDLLFPLRSRVLAGLAPALDDRKRGVRMAAAQARARWFLLTGGSA
jgi:hypothetical protein